MRILRTFRWHYDITVVLQYTPVVDDQLLLVTRLCKQFFCTKNTFLTVSVIRKLAIIKKQKYLIRSHCVRHVKYVMQRMSHDRLLQSITADSLLAPTKLPVLVFTIHTHCFFFSQNINVDTDRLHIYYSTNFSYYLCILVTR